MQKIIVIVCVIFLSSALKAQQAPELGIVDCIKQYQVASNHLKLKLVNDICSLAPYTSNQKKVTKTGETWVHMAVWRLSLDHLKSPLSKGKVSSKDLEMKNDLGQTPIYLAIENPEAYAVLGYIFNNYKIEKINVLTENMVSYLHKAVKEADPNVVQFFLEKGVDSSLTNKFGNTALDDTVLMNKPTLGNLIKNWKPSRD